jgi:mono/diheme cytochrome c family protein
MSGRLLIATLLILAVAACGDSTPATALDRGRRVYADKCSACHGSAGDGGVGPALEGVLVTWPGCSDHIRWVELGSEGWAETVGETYGATAKPIQGGMPGHATSLSAAEIAAVAAFERVTYGGADEAATLAECGLAAG